MKPLYLFYFKTKETFWASDAYIALEFEQYRQYLEGENIHESWSSRIAQNFEIHGIWLWEIASVAIEIKK